MTTMKGVVLRQRKYWMGWPGAAFPVDKYENEYPKRALGLAHDTGIDIDFAETIYDEEGADKFLIEIKSNPPDGLLIVSLSMGMWEMVDKITKSGVPTIIFAPIGTTFTGHVVDRSRQKGVYFVSSLDFQQIATGLRMIDTKKKLADERVLVLKGDSKKPVDTVVDGLGIEIRTIGREKVLEAYENVGETHEVRDVANWYLKNARNVVEPSKKDVINAARVYVACKKLLKEYEATAITMDCLGLVGSKLLDTTPCMAFSKLNDEGIPAACEADLDAILTMILLKHLLGKPSFMNDPVPETVRNVLVAAHCTSPTRLDGYGAKPETFILRSHSESDIGVSMQVLWREGQEITLAKFQGAAQMLVGSGTVVGNVDTPPGGGCRTSVEVKMKDTLDVRDVKGFHQLLMYGDHAKEIKDACQLLGIDVIPI